MARFRAFDTCPLTKGNSSNLRINKTIVDLLSQAGSFYHLK